MKPTLQLISALFLIAVGAGLLIAGFIVAPPGEIHNSVLLAFGEILTFAGAVFGMRYRYKYSAPDPPASPKSSVSSASRETSR
ncbi:MAG: hypothetical protein J1F07_08640 [Muribaculaceae bacterium]|nr:hypothetical protein [Muribaculaceae bacterium]